MIGTDHFALAIGALSLLVLGLGGVVAVRERRLRRLVRLVDAERARNDVLVHTAAHDPLTCVLNRTGFTAHVDLALARARLHARTVAVLFIDLDGFKQINDTLGHEVGDRLLARAGDRLRASVRRADAVGRVGGDEFVVLLEDVAGHEQVVEIAERLHVALHLPYVVEGRKLTVGASMGIAISLTGSETTADLLDDADAAMYLAKRAGRVSAPPALVAADIDLDVDDLRALAG